MNPQTTIRPQPADASSNDIAAVAEHVARGRERILAEIRKVIVGQDAVIDQVLIALFTGGHCLITGVPGLAKTLLVKTRRADSRPVVQAHPVHARPDACRHHRHGSPRRGGRASIAAVRDRTDLRAHHPGRRDQPHAAQDAGGAARGDAGVSRHGGRAHLSRSIGRSSSWRRRTRSSWRARIRCPRPSSIASCSTS